MSCGFAVSGFWGFKVYGLGGGGVGGLGGQRFWTSRPFGVKAGRAVACTIGEAVAADISRDEETLSTTDCGYYYAIAIDTLSVAAATGKEDECPEPW